MKSAVPPVLFFVLSLYTLKSHATECPNKTTVQAHWASIYSDTLEHARLNQVQTRLTQMHGTRHFQLFICDSLERQKLLRSQWRKGNVRLMPYDCREKHNLVELYDSPLSNLPVVRAC